MPGIETLQSFATYLLVIGLACALVREFYRAITQGSCDILTPCVRVLTAGLLLKHLSEVGDFFNTVSHALAGAVGDKVAPAVFAETWKHTVTGATALSWLGGWSFKIFFSIISVLILTGMYVVKVAIIDMLFPLRFGLTLFLGIFPISLSVFPKLGTLNAWFKQMLQVSLWPVIFQVLLSVSTGAFNAFCQEVQKIDFAAAVSAAFSDAASTDVSGLGWDDGPLFTLFKFLMLCVGYIWMTLRVPTLAATIVNSPVADAIGGMMAAKASSAIDGAKMSLLQGPLAFAAPFLGGVAAGGGDGDGGGAGDESLAASEGTSAGMAAYGSDDEANDEGMNARRYEPPRVDMGA